MTTLGSLLVQNHVVGVVEIEKALQRQVIMGGDLATNLLELSLVDEDALAKYTARAFGLPLLERALLVSPEEKVIKMIPWEVATQHRIVPVALEGNVMIVATFQPLQEHALDEIGFLLGVAFDPRFVLEFRLAIALNHFYGVEVSERFAKLQKKLAPGTIAAPLPIVPPPGAEGALATGLDPRTEADATFQDEAATVPADADYADTAKGTAAALEAGASVGAAAAPEPPAAFDTQPPAARAAPDGAPVETPAPAPEDGVVMVDAPFAEGRLDSAGVADDSPPESELPAALEGIDRTAAEGALQGIPDAGPAGLSAEELELRLLQVTHRDEILSVLMESVAQVFDFAMLFVIQGRDAHAHLKTTEEKRIEKVDSLVLSVDGGGMLEIAFETRSFYLGKPGRDDTDRLLLHEMNRRKLRNCAILPITLRNRVIMLLYGDCGVTGVKAEQLAELSTLTRLVADAFERLLLEKKYGQYRAHATNMPSKPVHPAFSMLPSERLSDMPSSAGRYRFVHSDDSGKLRPSMVRPRGGAAGHSGPGARGGAEAEPDAETRRRVASLMHSLIPGSSSFGGAPASDSDVSLEEAAVRAEKIVSVGGEERPRSVVVNMTEEIERLVNRVITANTYDKVAVEVLVGIGHDAVERLVTHFPGPLRFDRRQESAKLPKVSRHGYLLKALTQFGKIAVPHLIPLLSSHDSDVRFYATFLFSDLKFPEALDALTDRLFDPDRHIRAITVDVIRGFIAHPEYKWAVQKIIDRLESTEGDLDEKYMATRALGELGDPLAVAALATLLGSADEKLIKMSHRSLVKIALVDLGFAEQRWLDWYEQNRTRSRTEWAIDGLTNEDDDIRALAYRALRTRLSDVLEETAKPETLREYQELKSKLSRWWKEEGREIHQIVEGS